MWLIISMISGDQMFDNYLTLGNMALPESNRVRGLPMRATPGQDIGRHPAPRRPWQRIISLTGALPWPSLLVIDDDPAVLQVFRRSSTSRRRSSIRPPSATEGMQLLARHQVDAVLLDVMLPDADGPGGLRPHPRIDATAAGDLHHGRRRQRHGHRGHEAGAPSTTCSSRWTCPRSASWSSRRSRSAG